MRPSARPPTVGLLASLLVVMAVLWPYLSEPVTSVSAYYDTAPITPLAVGLLAMVSIIAFAAGRQRRSEPELVAGAVLILGQSRRARRFLSAVGLSAVVAGARGLFDTAGRPLVRAGVTDSVTGRPGSVGCRKGHKRIPATSQSD